MALAEGISLDSTAAVLLDSGTGGRLRLERLDARMWDCRHGITQPAECRDLERQPSLVPSAAVAVARS